MDAGQALAELTEISSQIELAVVFDSQGELIASTLEDGEAAETLARGGAALLAAASRAAGEERGKPSQVELQLSEGSILLAREGSLRILGVTLPDPVASLAFFDLRTCLRRLLRAEPEKRHLRVLKTRVSRLHLPERTDDDAA
jgi:predicted regulator of Ras-like GTPase activity (Roadblock/LC7/MglB family)